jgi:predicted anti-sigma-YlaC factor YlaD
MALDHFDDDQLQDLLDGNLTGAALHDADDHLAACPECQARADQYRALYRGLQDESEFVLPEGFAAQVAQEAESEVDDVWMSWPVLSGGVVISAVVAIGYVIGGERLLGFLKELELAQTWLREDLLTSVSVLVDSLGHRGELLFFGAMALVMVAILDRIVDSVKRGRAMFIM